MHEGFGYWISDVERTPELEAALEQANGAANPTTRLAGVDAAYWTNVGTKEHLRWVMPEPEDALLDGLARLHAARKDVVAEGSRFVGMFRAHGLLAPVWDLPSGPVRRCWRSRLRPSTPSFAKRLRTPRNCPRRSGPLGPGSPTDK